MPMFNFGAFLRDHWSNAEQLTRFVKTYGIDDLERPAAYKWYSRGQIPGTWLAVLLALLEIESGKPVAVAKYFKG